MSLTNAGGLLGVPEGPGGIETSEDPGALQLVASSAVEAGFATGVKTGDSHVPIGWALGKAAAQQVS